MRLCEIALSGSQLIKEANVKKILKLFKSSSSKLLDGMPALNKLISVCMKSAHEHRITSSLLMPALCKRIVKSRQIYNHSIDSYFLIMMQALYLSHAMGT